MTIHHDGNDHTVNYPELGGVEDQKVFYPEFAIYHHPSGSVYQQIGGKFILLQRSDGTKVRDAVSNPNRQHGSRAI